MISLRVAVVVLLCALCAHAFQAPPEAQRSFEEAVQHFKNQQWNEAEAAAKKALAADPRMADAEIGAAEALSTPTIIVNGKYRLQAQTAGGIDQMIQLVKFLVALESAPHTAAK